MKNMTSNDTDDVIWWVIDDFMRNSKICVNIYRLKKKNQNIYSSFGRCLTAFWWKSSTIKCSKWLTKIEKISIFFAEPQFCFNFTWNYIWIVSMTVSFSKLYTFLMCLCVNFYFKVCLGYSKVNIKWLNIPIPLCDLFLI